MADVYSIQGFLWKYKKGVTGGSWKKNWVYADSTVIAQYGGNQRPLPTEAPKYKWKIADCSIRSSDLRRFAFEVTMHGGGSGVSETAIFAADDSKSFEKWMKILIDTHVERERQEQSQSEERYSYDEVEAMRGGEEKSSVDVAPWQRVEQQAKDFFKRNKAKGTMTVADLIDLIHSIDERLVPHRVLTFLAIETKRTLDSAISLQDFIAFWRLYHYLFLPSEEEFHVFYSKDSRDVCFSPTTTTTTTTIPSNPSTTTNTATSSLFSEWNLLSSLSSDLSEVKVHPLYFRMHIPTTPTTSTPPNPTTPNSSNESKTRGLLLSLFQCYSPHTTATSLEGVSGGWHEVQCDLLHRLEEVRARIREVYEQRIYPSLEAKKEVLSEVVVVAPVVVERRGSAVTSSSDPIHSASAGNHTSELRALDEELLQVMSALALLQALFLSTAMKGARTVVDEFTLPQHLKTMRFVGNTPHSSDRGSGGGSVIGDDVMVFESQGIHFQLLNSLTLLQPSPNHPTTTTTTGTGVLGSDVIESALIARESLYDKYVAQEMKSFQYLNHSLHKRLLLQQLQQTYFPYLTSSSSSSSSDVMSSLRRSFLVQKMTSVVDYGGFRVLAFVPNHPPNQTTSSALLPEEQRASLLEEVQRGLAVKLPDGQAVGIESITLAQPTHAHPLHAKTAVTSRTVYYLTCKLLLPSDLTALHTSEVYMKSLRPELLQAYVTHISSNEREEGEQRQPPLILSTKELLDLYRDNADVSGRASSPSSLPHTSSSLFAEWREVCRFLYRQRIPRFVELLDNYDVMPYDSLSLTHAMHRHGLNMRHVGVVYSLCRNVIVKQLLLSDVIARGVKAVVRAMTKAHVYGQKQLSVVAERRQRSSASDFDELNAVTQTTKTDVIVEVLNLLFPTTSNTPSSTSSEATSAPEPQLHYLHYLRSHRKEEVLHFYELLLHVIEEKFGLTLTLSPHYSRGTSSGEGEEKEVLAEGVTSEHPLAHYSLHCFQLLSAVTYHLQVRLKEHVFHTSSQSSGGGAAVTSAGRSIVFSSNSMMIMKARDLTVLDLLDHHIATPSPTSSCFDHYDADDGVRLSSAGGPVYREEYSLLLPSFFSFLAHQRHLLADVTVVHTSYGRRAREEMMGMVTWRERQLILSEHVFDHSPNDPATYANYLKEVFAVAWSKWQMGGQEATYLLIEEKFLHRATFLHEYSLYNIPLYLLLMVVQYTQYTSYTQAMINYDLAHDVITTILPFSHPMLTLPMTVLAELYLTYPSHLSSHLLEDEDERERHYRSARRESLEYAKFFYQLALSVWRYTTTPAASSNHNLSSTTLTKTIANTAASSSSSAVIPVLVLQYKLAILQIELGELSDAVPVLQSCSKALETLLNSLLHQNYTSHTSHSSSGKKSKEVEKEVQGERIQAMTIVLRLLIPATYQLALCHYRLEEYDVALSLYQKTYQLFNKIIFNDALTRAMTSDSSSNTSSSVFLSLMSQNFYEVLLSSLLSMYDIYLLKHESALALDVLMLVYRLFVSKGYQSYLTLSSFYYYQHILWKLFCKMNELCVITLPMNVQALLESVTVEWNELMAGKGGHDTSAPPSSPGRSSDVARQRKNNQKLFSVACKLLVEIMFRGEMMDYVIQLLQMIQKQIHEDNALRYQYHNSGSAQFGPLEFNPQMDIKQLVNSIPTYAQAAAVSLLLKQPKDFAKYIM